MSDEPTQPAQQPPQYGQGLIDGTVAPPKFILDGSLMLLAKLRQEMEGATGKELREIGKLWTSTANGVFRARRRLAEKK